MIVKEKQIKTEVVEKKPEMIFSITTPSTILFCSLQELNCLYTQNVVMILGAITVVGAYFAIKSAIEKHHAKKLDLERSENTLSLHESIRELYLNKKSRNK